VCIVFCSVIRHMRDGVMDTATSHHFTAGEVGIRVMVNLAVCSSLGSLHAVCVPSVHSSVACA
jgi:hypothetical protein